MPVAYPLYTPTGPVARNRADRLVHGVGRSARARAGLRQLGRQHDAADAEPARARSARSCRCRRRRRSATASPTRASSWAWYSGGWANANGDVGDPGYTNGTVANPANPTTGATTRTSTQASGAACRWRTGRGARTRSSSTTTSRSTTSRTSHRALPGRAHLQDEADFAQPRERVGPRRATSTTSASSSRSARRTSTRATRARLTATTHLASTLRAIEGSACAKDTMVIVTYDEFGGQWDHVPPPGQGNNNGPHDVWGPGTRIPALVIAPHLKGDFVVDCDRARHDVDSSPRSSTGTGSPRSAPATRRCPTSRARSRRRSRRSRRAMQWAPPRRPRRGGAHAVARASPGRAGRSIEPLRHVRGRRCSRRERCA